MQYFAHASFSHLFLSHAYFSAIVAEKYAWDRELCIINHIKLRPQSQVIVKSEKELHSGDTGTLCTESLSGVAILVTVMITVIIGHSQGRPIINYTTITSTLHVYLGWTAELRSDQLLCGGVLSLILGGTARNFLCKVWGASCVTRLT